MWLLKESLSDLEKNNLQRTQEWTKSYIKFTVSYVHPKNTVTIFDYI